MHACSCIWSTLVSMLQHFGGSSSAWVLGVSHHHALGILASKEKGGGDGRAGVCSLRDLLCVLLHVLLQEVDPQDSWNGVVKFMLNPILLYASLSKQGQCIHEWIHECMRFKMGKTLMYQPASIWILQKPREQRGEYMAICKDCPCDSISIRKWSRLQSAKRTKTVDTATEQWLNRSWCILRTISRS